MALELFHKCMVQKEKSRVSPISLPISLQVHGAKGEKQSVTNFPTVSDHFSVGV